MYWLKSVIYTLLKKVFNERLRHFIRIDDEKTSLIEAKEKSSEWLYLNPFKHPVCIIYINPYYASYYKEIPEYEGKITLKDHYYTFTLIQEAMQYHPTPYIYLADRGAYITHNCVYEQNTMLISKC